MRFCLCVFESDTVKNDCPMQENYEIFKDFTVFKKKKAMKMKKKRKKSFENDQSTGHFQRFFFFFSSPRPYI